MPRPSETKPFSPVLVTVLREHPALAFDFITQSLVRFFHIFTSVGAHLHREQPGIVRLAKVAVSTVSKYCGAILNNQNRVLHQTQISFTAISAYDSSSIPSRNYEWFHTNTPIRVDWARNILSFVDHAVCQAHSVVVLAERRSLHDIYGDIRDFAESTSHQVDLQQEPRIDVAPP